MLEISDLTCGYDNDFFLQDINLKINERELIGIIGPNSSGKTTLLRAITRVLRPMKGKILFKGKDIWQISLKELSREIAVVTQNPPGNYMRVKDFVLMGRIPHYKRFQFFETKQDIEISERCMILTNTLKFKDKSLNQISGGERQLVSIARALAQEPQLLLLDEPTAHLDIAHQIGIMELIKRLNKEFGLTVIMVLHDLNLASEYCDRLILLSEGRVYKTGAPHSVLTYQVIEDVYKTLVLVKENPLSRRPYVFLVSKEVRERGEHGK